MPTDCKGRETVRVLLLSEYVGSPVERMLGGRVVYRIAGPVVREDIDAFTPDLVVSFGYRHKIPPHVREWGLVRWINIHPSMLPLNRGADPHVWAAIEGQAQGVTIHDTDDRYDGGAVIIQRVYRFMDTIKMSSVRLELHQYAADLLEQVIDDLPVGVPQNEDRATYHYASELDYMRDDMCNKTTRELRQ